MDNLLSVLPWVAPPILGAIIGYVTNRIAIQMLFRPHTAKRVLGIRVPLTPGIIPRSRNELAQQIGKTVAGELLSPGAVRTRLNNPEFRTGLERWIGEQRRALMNARLDAPETDVQELLADLMPVLASGLQRLLGEPQVRAAMVAVGSDMVRDTVANQGVVVRTAIGASRIDRAVINRMPAVVDAIANAAESATTAERVAESVAQWTQTSGGARASDFLVLSEATEARIDGYLSERLVAFLSDELPAISAMLNVEQLVAERVNSFSAPEVERMILDAAGRHLRWINYFGASLGAVIGLIQVALQLVA